LSQPDLLETRAVDAPLVSREEGAYEVGAVVAPKPLPTAES
jgi:hypothetical protein